jgi:Protein of unknown function (DUF2510)
MTTTPPDPIPAGWYPDIHDASLSRWWDGAGWTPMTRAVGVPESQPVSLDVTPPVTVTGQGQRSGSEIADETKAVDESPKSSRRLTDPRADSGGRLLMDVIMMLSGIIALGALIFGAAPWFTISCAATLPVAGFAKLIIGQVADKRALERIPEEDRENYLRALRRLRADNATRAADAARSKADATRAEKVKVAEMKTAARSLVPSKDGQGYMCPKCHGKQFKVKRSGGQKAAIIGWGVVSLPVSGVGGALVASHFIKRETVRCTTCGGDFMKPSGPPNYAVEG